jgi:hypothetical protein
MSGFAVFDGVVPAAAAAADGSSLLPLAEEDEENARDVMATAAPLSAPTNKTHALTSTMTVRSVCLRRSEEGPVLRELI